MHRTTCFLIFDKAETLTSTRKLVGEHFPETSVQETGSVEQLLEAITLPRHPNQPIASSQILITDRRCAVEAVGRSGIYFPVVCFGDQDATTSSAHFSICNVDSSFQLETAVEAISSAIDSSTQYSILKSKTANLDSLAERERKIIAMATDGIPNKTIAVRLGISIKTVEKNRRNAYSKLAVSSTAEMASLVTFGRFCGSFAQ